MPKIFVTELLFKSMLRFKLKVELTEKIKFCPVIDLVFVGDTDEKRLCIALEYTHNLKKERRYLMRGELMAIGRSAQHLNNAAVETVIWLKSIDALIVESWPRPDFEESDFATAQGELIELRQHALRG